MKNLNATIITFLAIISCAPIYAQKLPTEQESSLRAPANVKIDGKATELNNTFQAYNNHTDFYYTMSNDDNNLYLTIQATDAAIVRRIINGGVTLTINKSGQKKDKDGISITYPVFEKNNKFIPNMGGRTGIAALMRNSVASSLSGEVSVDIRQISSDNNTMSTRVAPAKSDSKINTDSLAIVNNNNMADRAKYIRVSGIKDVDTLISVYNQDGIKAAASFDNKLAYTCELSIALKQLNLSVSNPVKFSYQLLINEVVIQTTTTYTYNQAGAVTGFRMEKKEPGASQQATDFWSEYTLAK